MATEEKKGDGEEKKEEEMKWWQLKRVAVGFWVIIILIAFGILQPLLWELLPTDAPESATTLSTLLTIIIALFALVLTAFSVLIYDILRKELTAHITTDVVTKAHKHIEGYVNKAIREHEDLSEKREKAAQIRQTLFRAQILRTLGYNYWQLFLVWECTLTSHFSAYNRL